ncbi:MAG: HAD family hydrolase [Candidatus Marinimicrobia bacterium]|jgi:putative hydrolase of the HAD superfamily|nr:HAD family hydrolase [Candidatus Neomarinimicrobiota bacterium]MBT3840174.1 HAD family hydrolase [Candidatus Neomarinimicrobiota bacterium]MBT3999168.1 HAD family hydrolase [Candidatus Neomarinimicrobiota bacterium]MBT4282604.1 HAD family hydrolase [Candidatus Neomarinimicrobiota bacterium]MBT4579700.1 HAD family hydrolase [Candidatus Neomarinimicrobiota bacterium]
MIKGITFDLWDTVFIDDSDETKRAKAGRPSKAIERRQLIHSFVSKQTNLSLEIISQSYDNADKEFKEVWHNEHITWPVHHRLSRILNKLNVNLSEQDMNELVRAHEEMELEFRPDFIPGIHDAITKLSKVYQLGVISDAIFSPGRVLRQLLKDEGILNYFEIFAFSDEVGHSKPHKSMFQHAWNGLNLLPKEIVHIGDREHNDITGPHAFGMKAILCTAAVDRDSTNTKADDKFNDYSELPNILEELKNT